MVVVTGCLVCLLFLIDVEKTVCVRMEKLGDAIYSSLELHRGWGLERSVSITLFEQNCH